MTGLRKPTIPRQNSYNSLYVNPLIDPKHNRSCSEGARQHQPLGEITQLGAFLSCPNQNAVTSYNQNAFKTDAQNTNSVEKENLVSKNFCIEEKSADKVVPDRKSYLKEGSFKPTSLQHHMQLNEPDSAFWAKIWDPVDSEKSNSVNIWDYSDSEAAPASSWSTLPNRALLCKPLPVDVGRCACFIVKEVAPKGFGAATFYSLYTNEGHGRQNRKLAIACHRRRRGRSEFIIAQNSKGILCKSDDSFLGVVTANFLGSKYCIWDQGSLSGTTSKKPKLLQAAVAFTPTVATWTGSYRRMKAWIPKHQHMQLKNTSQIKHIKGLPQDWRGKTDKVNKLLSRVPQYNTMSKQYELDFRERGRAGLRIQSSVKNFQLTIEGNPRQTVILLGRVGKSMFLMDYRYPLTGYQAFCICLASMDSKLCCMV